MPRFLLTFLGGFQARLDAGPSVTVSSRKAQALLAYLALPSGRPHAREKLATLLGGDLRAELARTSLRQSLLVLRRALAPVSPSPLRLHGDTATLDPVLSRWTSPRSRQPRRPLTGRRSSEPSRSTGESSWTACASNPNPSRPGSWSSVSGFASWPSRRWRAPRPPAAGGSCRPGAPDGAASAGAGSAPGGGPPGSDAPLRPASPTRRRTPAIQRVLGRAAAGARARPRAADAAALPGDPAPSGGPPSGRGARRDTAARSWADRPGASDARRTVYRDPALRSSGGAPADRPRAELACLAAALADVRAGHGRLLTVVGEAGVGKSRLLAEVAAAAGTRRRSGARRPRLEPEQVLPFAPWVDAFRSGRVPDDLPILEGLLPRWRGELTRLIPEISSAAPPVDSTDHRTLFEAVGVCSRASPSGSRSSSSSRTSTGPTT